MMKKAIGKVFQYFGVVTLIIIMAIGMMVLKKEITVSSVSSEIYSKMSNREKFDMFEQYAIKNGYYINYSRGVSMSPSNSCELSISIYREVDIKDDIIVGQVYVYESEEMGRAQHRLVESYYSEELGETKYIFQGDNPVTNYIKDPYVLKSQIKSEVMMHFVTIEEEISQDECYKLNMIEGSDFYDYIIGDLRQVVVEG